MAKRKPKGAKATSPKRLWALAVAVVVGVGVGVPISRWVGDRVQDVASPPKSKQAAALRSVERRMASVPEYQAVFGRLSPEDGAKLRLELAQQGLECLDDAQLLRRTEIIAKLLEFNDDTFVASLYHGPLAPRALERALEKLPRRDVQDWYDLSWEAILAKLRNRPMTAFDPAALPAASRKLDELLGPDDAERLHRIGRSKDCPDADRAWAMRTIYSRLPMMPEPHHTAMVRAMALTGAGTL